MFSEEPEKVAHEHLFHLAYVGLVPLEHLENARPFNYLLHFFFEFVRFDFWYKVLHRRRKGSKPYMTKNDATEDLYFGMKRDTAKLEKWHNARHRTPHGRMTPMGKASPSLALRCSLPPLLEAPPLKSRGKQ